jgi:hypothetical protein
MNTRNNVFYILTLAMATSLICVICLSRNDSVTSHPQVETTQSDYWVGDSEEEFYDSLRQWNNE